MERIICFYVIYFGNEWFGYRIKSVFENLVGTQYAMLVPHLKHSRPHLPLSLLQSSSSAQNCKIAAWMLYTERS